ncbi:YLR445W-like protein [Saccharomyces cerevisiae x Saccharomyces kudriavzevii VIN7]|uniref:YLR445W-like protein n=1 Tax=Saccharomyces cerevisiae x Saccharomyces kudriavzevii (strain VIN7) TaxID=1095631 RepID=H0GYT0_SACCK|nr:YLR445W-like protein [Saccharomyces cerevisiae x Saccharomyces kudriavzevii VIN7]
MNDTTDTRNRQLENEEDTSLAKIDFSENAVLNNKVPSLFKLAAEWQINNPQESFQTHVLENEVLKRITEITGLIKESYKDLSNQDGMMSKELQEKMDWDLFCTVPVNIIEQYTKDMDEIFEKMEKLSKVSTVKDYSFHFPSSFFTNNTYFVIATTSMVRICLPNRCGKMR